MFKRYTLSDVTSNQFYQMPKFLFQGELKNSLSNDAKVLYSLLRDRHELSLKNNWVNESNEVYLIMTRDEMCDLLGISIKPVLKAINQLKEFGLMQEVRQGLNKPNLLFLLNYTDIKSWTCQNDNSEPVIMTPQDLVERQFWTCQNDNSKAVKKPTLNLSNSHTNNTYPNQTDLSDTDYQSIYPHEHEADEIDTIQNTTEIIKENIEYTLCKQIPGESEYIDNIVSVMVDVICSTSSTIRIGGEVKPLGVVKSIFMKLSYEHIQYVCLCLSQNTTQIKNIRSYLITALYNAPQTMDTYYSQRVKHDMIL
ncbi:DUF6017 domain-containing protein [Paludicola sp. MB14-C6]|uniref:DUF6017 domain-containing protein n=1 Tax=Paludihabitans sp. MB14-C6 TaxID=3070656 RepID=UPI0027DEA0B6|nr:DUF6017 domain-containing protein [Paludicola sp. MB14-C6]WMJ24285.1 DUF6017 domain-containing protein [Paludicola sp. MB14-C6]